MKIHHSSDVSSPETSDKENESEIEIPITHSQTKLRGTEAEARKKTVHPQMRTSQEIPTVVHSMQLAAEDLMKIRELKISK